MTITEVKTGLKTDLTNANLLAGSNIQSGLITIIDDSIHGGIEPPVISLRTLQTKDYDMIRKPGTYRDVSFAIEYILSAGSEYPVGVKLEELSDLEFEKFEQALYFWCIKNNAVLTSIDTSDYTDDSSSTAYRVIIAKIDINIYLVVPDSISGRPFDDYEGIEKQTLR